MQLSLRNHPAQAQLNGQPLVDGEGRPIPLIPPEEQQAVYLHDAWPQGRMIGYFLHIPGRFAPTVPMDRAVTDAITAELARMLGRDVPAAPVITPIVVEADDDDEGDDD